jgi:hypothetical protein
MKKILNKGDFVQVSNSADNSCIYPEFFGRVGVIEAMTINASYFYPKSSVFLFATIVLYKKDGSTETKTFRTDYLKTIKTV